jgi:predicted DNA binding CopG/RHH family protein
MKKEYDLSKMKRRPGKVKVYPEALKSAISLRIDSGDLGELKKEACRMGIPYQTLIGSILHRYVTGDLIDIKSADIAKILQEGK